MKAFITLAVAVMVAIGIGVFVVDVTTTHAPRPKVISTTLSSVAYSIGLQSGLVAVEGRESPIGGGNGCQTQLFDPTSLRLIRTLDSCTSEFKAAGGHLVVDSKSVGEEVHAVITNSVTHKKSIGPLLMTEQSWPWAHSGVTYGNGSVWIYDLSANTLLQVSTATGRIAHRWSVDAGTDPWMAVNADGFWMTEGVWGGSFCSGACKLWHVGPDSNRLSAVKEPGVGAQWIDASGNSIYEDEVHRMGIRFTQTIVRFVGPHAHVAYETPATILPSPDFGGTGYVVEGNPQAGYFTISQLGTGDTPEMVGDCATSAAVRVVRIDPATGRQSYVAKIPTKDDDTGDCHLYSNTAVFADGSLYFLSGSTQADTDFGVLVRVAA